MADYADEIEVFQGDTTRPIKVAVEFLLDGETLQDYWECRTSLIDKRGNVIISPRLETTLTDDNLNWVIYLTEDDTALVNVPNLPVEVIWVIEVRNPATVPVYNREQHILVKVKKQGF